MKILLLTILLLSTAANALIIKGEESDNNFIQVREVGDKYYFLNCEGSFKEYSCDGFYSIPMTFSAEEIRSMANDKDTDMYLAAGADVALIIAAFYVLPISAMNAEIAWAVRHGHSLDGGVGGASALIALMGGGAAVTTAEIAIDSLDPFVHRDLSLSLSTIVGETDHGDLDDLDAIEVKLDQVVTIEDVTTSQVKKSFKKLLDEFVESRNYSFQALLE